MSNKDELSVKSVFDCIFHHLYKCDWWAIEAVPFIGLFVSLYRVFNLKGLIVVSDCFYKKKYNNAMVAQISMLVVIATYHGLFSGFINYALFCYLSGAST